MHSDWEEDREEKQSFYAHQVILCLWKQGFRPPGVIQGWEVQRLPGLATSGPGSGFWFLGPPVFRVCPGLLGLRLPVGLQTYHSS